jgi:hypothetical protein
MRLTIMAGFTALALGVALGSVPAVAYTAFRAILRTAEWSLYPIQGILTAMVGRVASCIIGAYRKAAIAPDSRRYKATALHTGMRWRRLAERQPDIPCAGSSALKLGDV